MSPYGYNMSCERWLERSIEIQLDSNLDQESKYNLIAYLRQKVPGGVQSDVDVRRK